MKKFFKRILIVLLIILIAIQFIRPAKNISGGISANDISTKYAVPDSIQAILKVACNDCHSNNTRYPWYNQIQPITWGLKKHIKYGKRGLNFADFTAYRLKQQFHRLDDIDDLVQNNARQVRW